MAMHWQALPTTLSLVRCYWAGDTGGTEAGQVASGGRTPVHLLRPLPLFQGGSGRGERGKRQNKLGRCLHCLTMFNSGTLFNNGAMEDYYYFRQAWPDHITSYYDLIHTRNSNWKINKKEKKLKICLLNDN